MSADESGFFPARVEARREEAAGTVSFLLRPLDPANWRAHQPGQHLALRLLAGPGGAMLIRTRPASGA